MTQTKKKKQQPDIYQKITDQVIELLEEVDLKDYEAPFASLAAQGLPTNPFTEKQYNGVNIPCLWFYQQKKGFKTNEWATFKQWKDKDAQVRKGEKGSQIVFYKTLLKTEKNEQGEEDTHKIPMLKLYTVFNADQVDGYEPDTTTTNEHQDPVKTITLIEEFCKNTGAVIQHGGYEAYYAKSSDYIQMPDKESFRATKYADATENYYSVLFHELTHWTGAPHRLDRDKAQSKQEQEKYAFEELVAQLGAAFLSAQTSISQTAKESDALYIKSWLKALRNDNKYIFRASAQAGQAVSYLNELQR